MSRLAGQINEIEESENALRSLGLSEEEIAELGNVIDVIGDKVFDHYFAQFYE